ncbi:MAG: DNA adenine methylase [Stenotrophomonas sp.]|nr:DNA adenine methylase [Stenotrophomonas sp.]
MGSKSKIMDFVLEGINEVYTGGVICDLFAGSASLAGAVGDQAPVHSNDIQNYSATLAQAYLTAWRSSGCPSADDVLAQAEEIVARHKRTLGLNYNYKMIGTLEEFNHFEREQQKLIERSFRREWHLFVKNYSGTWWSAEQCLWIDAIRQIAEKYRDLPIYPVILSSLMYAMAYTSQGTGHYAQYRDAKTESSMKDILIYRRRDVAPYFRRKYEDVAPNLASAPPQFHHSVSTLDFSDCLDQIQGGTVYADPPYCFVHYSRFYHAIETLVLYDYPEIQQKNGTVVKGRYREGRHQSPFCIRTQVPGAFMSLFEGVKKAGASLVLSYSNTGMITIDEVGELAARVFKNETVEILTTDHQHMTLGRQKDRHREVEECLLLIR